MLEGVLLLFVSVLGFALAWLVLRADPQRLDNRMLALMCGVDAASAAARGVLALDGYALTEPTALLTCVFGPIFLSYLSLEFGYSFPFNRRAPRWVRWPAALGTIVTMVLFYHPATTEWMQDSVMALYFVPYFAVTAIFLRLNYTKTTSGNRQGVHMVMSALVLRWVAAIVTFLVAKRISPAVFEVSLFLEATVFAMVAYLLLSNAILRYQLFRVRGALAQMFLYGSYFVVVIGLTEVAIEAALRWAPGTIALRTFLLAAALIPIAALWIGSSVRARIEETLLCSVDPRRAKRKQVLERVVHPSAPLLEPDKLIESTRLAMADVTVGGQGRYVRAADLPPPLGEELRVMNGMYLLRQVPHGLSRAATAVLNDLEAELVVPVRADGKLHGALLAEGGTLDRDSILTAVTLAGHLALRLENIELFAELEESRRLATLGSFAAAIAHDIRTPLTSVQMNVQILRGKAKLPPDDMEYFDIALEELRRLNAHVSEILDYAKPVRLHPIAVDLREVADEAARGMEPILSDRKLALAREHATELPPVLGDAQRIRQVLLNLLDNAAKASPDGAAIVMRTRSASDGKVALEVCDSGRGIDAGDLDKIFEPFFTTRADGTGLGLAICQKLIKAHSGEITVRSTPGKGSIFTILLPVAA